MALKVTTNMCTVPTSAIKETLLMLLKQAGGTTQRAEKTVAALIEDDQASVNALTAKSSQNTITCCVLKKQSSYTIYTTDDCNDKPDEFTSAMGSLFNKTVLNTNDRTLTCTLLTSGRRNKGTLNYYYTNRFLITGPKYMKEKILDHMPRILAFFYPENTIFQMVEEHEAEDTHLTPVKPSAAAAP